MKTTLICAIIMVKCLEIISIKILFKIYCTFLNVFNKYLKNLSVLLILCIIIDENVKSSIKQTYKSRGLAEAFYAQKVLTITVLLVEVEIDISRIL